MLSAFLSAFRTPDLRKKLLFTVGDHRRVPARRHDAQPGRLLRQRPATASTTVNSTDASGASEPAEPVLRRCAAVSCRSSRSASCRTSRRRIILQLLTVVIPRLEQLRKEGQSGQAKITQYTRYLTLGLAILQSSAFVALAEVGPAVRRRLPRPAVPGHPGEHRHPDVADADHAGHHHDRRNRCGHVAGRADHRPRRRQRHVRPDLHLDRRPAPRRGLADPGSRAAGASSSSVSRSASGDHRGGGLHRAGAAPHPGAVRQADDRPAHVRRHVDLHPAEGQPGRCHPGHLRVLAALPAAAVPAVLRPEQPQARTSS